MKNFFTVLLGVLVINSVYAAETPKLRVSITGQVKGTHYICFSNMGCINIKGSSKVKTLPMQSGDVHSIFVTDLATLRMYPQSLPNSCKATVNDNQTLTVSGKIASKNDTIYVQHLHCSVS